MVLDASETVPLSKPITRAGQHQAPISAGMEPKRITKEIMSPLRSAVSASSAVLLLLEPVSSSKGVCSELIDAQVLPFEALFNFEGFFGASQHSPSPQSFATALASDRCCSKSSTAIGALQLSTTINFKQIPHAPRLAT